MTVGKPSIDWVAAAAAAAAMSLEEIHGALRDIRKTLPVSDSLDQIDNGTRGGYYRDQAGVLRAEIKNRQDRREEQRMSDGNGKVAAALLAALQDIIPAYEAALERLCELGQGFGPCASAKVLPAARDAVEQAEQAKQQDRRDEALDDVCGEGTTEILTRLFRTWATGMETNTEPKR